MHWAVRLWIILAVAHTVKTLIDPAKRSVYPIFAQSARDWWAGTNLYGVTFGSGYYYGPSFAVLASPLGWLPDRVGAVLWSMLSLGLLFYALRVWVRDVLRPLFPSLNEGLFLALSIGATIQGAWSSQSNAVILGMLLLAASAVARGRWWAAAFLLALPIQIKLWPIMGAGLLVLRWPKQLTLRLAAASLLLALLPMLTKSPAVVLEQYGNWVACVLKLLFKEARHTGYRDAWTIWEELFPPVQRTVYQLIQLVSTAGLVAYCFIERRRSQSAARFLCCMVTLWICWELFMGPGSERLTYGLIAPFVSLAVVRSFSLKRGRALTVWAWLFTGPLGTGAFEQLIGRVFPAAPVLLPCSLVPLAVWYLFYEPVTKLSWAPRQAIVPQPEPV